MDWRTNGFHSSDRTFQVQSLWIDQYHEWKHLPIKGQDTPLEQVAKGICGDKFWFLGKEDGNYFLQIYDTSQEETEERRFTPKDLGLNGDNGFFAGMDMVNEETFLFRWAEYTQDEEVYTQTTDLFVFADLNGNTQSVNVRELFKERKIESYFPDSSCVYPTAKFCMDKKGNFCVLDQNGRFYLINRACDILLEYDCASQQYLLRPFFTVDDELILPVFDQKEKNCIFLWADYLSKEFHFLGALKDMYVVDVYGMWGEDVYYRGRSTGRDLKQQEGIVKWNIQSGEQTQILNFSVSGISNYITMLAMSGEKTPVLRMSKEIDETFRDWVVLLADTKPINEGKIRVMDFTGQGELLEKCVTEASMEYPGPGFIYQNVSSEEEKTRIFVEFLQGKGPDMLLLNEDDLYALAEKGLLTDIEPLLSEKTKSELLPAVLEMGRVNGELLGIPIGVYAETLAANSKFFDGKTNLEQVIALMECGRLNGALRSPYFFSESYLNPIYTVLFLINNCLENSFLIDWENRKSHFDDERFVKLLELTRTDLSKQNAGEWDGTENDLVFGWLNAESDLVNFFANLEKHQLNVIGFPSDQGGKNYLLPQGGFFAVNSGTLHSEAVSGYLEILFGRNMQASQMGQCIGVRKLSPQDYLFPDHETGELLFMGSMKLPILSDGLTPLEKAKIFLESCEALPRRYPQIYQIILDELNNMHTTQKSEREIAEIINTRVQLYLDEIQTGR